MFCNQCGQKIDADSNVCSHCGALTSGGLNQKKSLGGNTVPSALGGYGAWNAKRIISVVVVLIFIAFAIYRGLDGGSIDKNNNAMESYNSGDTQAAISQFQQASQDAVTNDTKITSLKNLGYAHATDGQNAEALASFKEALSLTDRNSFNYYLVSGEIALLENNPSLALSNYNKAYQLDPKDFQVNNSLSLLYLNIDGTTSKFENYPKALVYAKAAYENDTEKTEISKQNLAIAYYFNKNFDQTISLLSTTNLTQHPYINYWLGLAYVSKKDDTNARLYLQRAVDAGVKVPKEVHDYLNSF